MTEEADLTEVIHALEKAKSAHEKGLAEEYVWSLNFAHGRLSRVLKRADRLGRAVDAVRDAARQFSDWKEAKG